MLRGMNRRGFTIIELIIVITIMGILLVLGVVNLRSTQVNARDDTRKANVDTIAFNLETFYKSGTDTSNTFGRYPSTALIGQEQVMLRDIDPKSLLSPGGSSSALVAATNNIATTAGVATAVGPPYVTIANYVYQPLQADGTLCVNETQECRQFNLYYKLEGDGITYQTKSKNQ